MYSQRFKEIKNLKLNTQTKPLQLGKVGKSTHGECKIEQGKIVFPQKLYGKTNLPYSF